MEKAMIEKIIWLAERNNVRSDPSHDMIHLKRVMSNAIIIARKEGGDLNVVIPAALFHDLITYRKDDARSQNAQAESARLAGRLLAKLGLPKRQIAKISYCIEVCSFSKNIMPETLEAKIVQDADMLEATGATAIMRTFASSGVMQRGFYNEADPFCETRAPTPKKYAVDLFYSRLFVVRGRMHTKTARRMAARRERFMRKFIAQLKGEIRESSA